MIHKRIAIIGAGNMGTAIAQGILKHKIINKSDLLLSNRSVDNSNTVSSADIVVLSVKPQKAIKVLTEIKDQITPEKLIISVMAGIRMISIESVLGSQTKIVRSMPNLAARVGKSMTCWVHNQHVTANDIVEIKAIFSSFGTEILLEREDDINIATAVSGSGPAYFFYLAHCIEETAISMGLSEKHSRLLVTQTIVGAAKILQASTDNPNILIQNVMSKGGTTEAAFDILYHQNIATIIMNAIQKARERAVELSR